MAIDRAALRWNGWGRRDRSGPISPAQKPSILSELARQIGGRLGTASQPAPLSGVQLPACRLEAAARDALEQAVGASQVHTDAAERAIHAAGKSLPDLLRVRSGQLERAPDAVVYPTDIDAVSRCLRAAREHGVAVVPFGGGTSVVGGVEPLLAEGQHAVVALDTTRLDQLIALDEHSGTATFQAGIDGPALEAELASRRFTLGHYPQSFEHSTLGGWIAARSSGQQSDGYGGIEALLVGVRLVTPEGEIRTLGVPRSAAGPDFKELILGSEGVLGVIVEATVRVRKTPAVQDVRGMMFPRFEAGTAAIHALGAAGLPMTMMRLSDAPETELSLLMRPGTGGTFDPTSTLLSAIRPLGFDQQRSVFLYGIEGDDGRRVSAQMLRATMIGLRHGGLPLGRGPGRSWRAERFRTPYLRDLLLDEGVAIDTMETAFEWSRLDGAHDEVLRAIEASTKKHAGGGIAMGHLSHSYHDGACLYFVVLYPLDLARGIEQWRLIKSDITDAILRAGGTLSHHHGVGVDHAPWMEREQGPLALEALRALKQRLDPAGIMNPGKLL